MIGPPPAPEPVLEAEDEALARLAELLGGGRGAARARARTLLLRRDLDELAASAPDALVAELGLSRPTARRLAAAFGLARCLERHRRPRRPSLGSPERVHTLLASGFRGLEQETFLALLLDGKHRLRRIVPVSVGTLTTSLVHPREVYRAAIREAAAAVIVAHNHPSGDPEPSREDVEVTRRLRAAGELVGVPLLDHVVCGEGAWVSLREREEVWRAG